MADSTTATDKGTRKFQCSAPTKLGDTATKLAGDLDESFGIRAMLLFAALPANDKALHKFVNESGPFSTTGEKWTDPEAEKRAKLMEGLTPAKQKEVQLALKEVEDVENAAREAKAKAKKAMQDAMAKITKIKG